MNELIVIEVRIEAAALTPEEKTLFDLFRQLPPKTLVRCIRMLHFWLEAPAPQRALAVKLLDGGLLDKHVAQLCGLSDRQLRRYEVYKRFAGLLRELHGTLPRGCKEKDGALEAWEE